MLEDKSELHTTSSEVTETGEKMVNAKKSANLVSTMDREVEKETEGEKIGNDQERSVASDIVHQSLAKAVQMMAMSL